MADIYLFSNVEGRVLLDGQPVPNVEVEQEFIWAWNDEKGVVRVMTDADGRFSFPAVTRKSFWASLLPHDAGVRQTILLHHNGQIYKGWMANKGNYALNGELDGKPIVLTCDLADSPAHVGDVYGICRLH